MLKITEKGLTSLSSDDLFKYGADSFDGITSIDLSENDFVQLPAAVLTSCSQLSSLAADDCQVDSLAGLVGVPCVTNVLRVLRLAGNRLEKLPDALKCHALEVLDLKNNCFSKFPGPVCRFAKLTSLDLCENELTHSDSSWKALAGQLPKLKTLLLDANELRRLPEQLCQLPALRRLSLKHNHIKEVPAALQGASSLRELYMNHNRVKKVPKFVYLMPKLKAAVFTGNPCEVSGGGGGRHKSGSGVPPASNKSNAASTADEVGSNPWDVLGAETREEAVREGKVAQLLSPRSAETTATGSKQQVADAKPRKKAAPLPMFVGAQQNGDDNDDDDFTDDDDDDDDNYDDGKKDAASDSTAAPKAGSKGGSHVDLPPYLPPPNEAPPLKRTLSGSNLSEAGATSGSLSSRIRSFFGGSGGADSVASGNADGNSNSLKVHSRGSHTDRARHHRRRSVSPSPGANTDRGSRRHRTSGLDTDRSSGSSNSGAKRRPSDDGPNERTGRSTSRVARDAGDGRREGRSSSARSGSRSRSRSRHRTIVDGSTTPKAGSSTSTTSAAMSIIDQAVARGRSSAAADVDGRRTDSSYRSGRSPTRSGRSPTRAGGDVRRRSRSHSRSRRTATTDLLGEVGDGEGRLSRGNSIKKSAHGALEEPPLMTATAFVDNLRARKHDILQRCAIGPAGEGGGRAVSSVADGSSWLDLLMMPWGYDAELQRAFILHMPSVFKSMSTLFQLLLAHWERGAADARIRLRLLSFLRDWLQQAPEDFLRRKSTARRLTELMDLARPLDGPVRDAYKLLAKALKDAAKQRSQLDVAADKAVARVNMPPPLPPASSGPAAATANSASVASSVLMELKAADLAQAMTFVEAQLHRAVPPRAWLTRSDAAPAAGQQSVGDEQQAAAIDRLMQRSQLTEGWLLRECLVNERGERCRRIARLIAVAAHCLVLQNYAGVLQCMAALSAPSVRRLRRTWAALAPAALTALADLRALTDDVNGGGLAALMTRASPPSIWHPTAVMNAVRAAGPVPATGDGGGESTTPLTLDSLSGRARVVAKVARAVSMPFDGESPSDPKRQARATRARALLNGALETVQLADFDPDRLMKMSRSCEESRKKGTRGGRSAADDSSTESSD